MNIIGAAAAIADPTQTNPTTTPTGTTSTSTSTAGLNGLTNETTFLNLLVAQIKNQDPLNPADSTQFVGQLVQFSQLEQLLGINSGVKDLDSKVTPPTTPATPPATPVAGKQTNLV